MTYWIAFTSQLTWVLLVVQNLVGRPCCLLLQHSIPAPYLCSILPCCWCIWPVFNVLREAWIVLALALSWTACLINLCSTLLGISLHPIITSNTMIVGIVDSINGVFSYVQLIIRILVLECLVLSIGCDAALFKVLWFHQLLIGLCMWFHCIKGILSKFKLSTSFLFYVLTSSRRRWLHNLIAMTTSNWSLSWNRPFLLHEVLIVCLFRCYHLLWWLAQSWSDCLTTIGAGSS